MTKDKARSLLLAQSPYLSLCVVRSFNQNNRLKAPISLSVHRSHRFSVDRLRGWTHVGRCQSLGEPLYIVYLIYGFKKYASTGAFSLVFLLVFSLFLFCFCFVGFSSSNWSMVIVPVSPTYLFSFISYFGGSGEERREEGGTAFKVYFLTSGKISVRLKPAYVQRLL